MKTPVKHWLLQRLTAVPMVLTVFYFITQTKHLAAVNRMEFLGWVKQPVTAAVLAVFIFCAFYHASLGMDEIIEDYAPSAALKTINKLFFAVLGIASLYAVLAIYLGKF